MSEPVFNIEGPVEDAYESAMEEEIAKADEVYFSKVGSEPRDEARNWNRIYDRNPSEVVFVPNKSGIKKTLADLLKRVGKKVPKNLEDMPHQQAYAIYFKLMGIEKFDPEKHI